MQKQQVQAYLTLLKIFAAVGLIAVLYAVAPRFQEFDSLSSDDVEEMLYQRIDELNRAVTSDATLAGIVITADADPVQLSLEEQRQLLAHELQFYTSWEVAWSYRGMKVLGVDTWDKWNSWFVAEARQRPGMGWRENRRNFSGGFVSHVDKSLPHGERVLLR